MKKTVSALLAAAMLLTAITMLMIPTSAASEFVGYSSARVEKQNLADVANIKDYETTEADTYKITDAEGLVLLSEAVLDMNSFIGKTIYLANDIDMTDVTDFDPIGYSSRAYFAGTFDGQGHVIDNLVLASTAKGYLEANKRIIYVALFGYLAEGATVKNLVLGKHCSFTYFGGANIAYVGGLVAGMKAIAGKPVTVDNCQSMARVEGSNYAGGIVTVVEAGGSKANTIRNCTNTGDVICTGPAAGFCTLASGKLLVENSRNTGKISLNLTKNTATEMTAAAGFVALPAENSTTVSGCINNGRIEGPFYIGAFFGSVLVNGNKVENCTHYGMVDASADRGGTRSGVLGNLGDGINLTQSSIADKEGKTDASLAQMETITPDFTVKQPLPEETTATPDTNPAPNEDGGCASVAGTLSVLLCMGMALAVKKGAKRK